jgi:hypothetical protein
MSEIEQVARALLAHQVDTGQCDPDISWTSFEGEARAAIRALDAFRAEEKRRTCKHLNRTGTGSLGSNGFGWSTWYCQECGASYDSRTIDTEAAKAERE